MDFASEPHTSVLDPDSNFSEDLEERRIKAGVAAKAWVTIGLAWRSPDVSECGTYETLLTRTLQYIAYLRWLAFAAHAERQAEQEASMRRMVVPAKKKRRTAVNQNEWIQEGLRRTAFKTIGASPLVTEEQAILFDDCGMVAGAESEIWGI